MKFETLFRVLSYLTVLCGSFTLWITGAFGFAGALFFMAVMIAAWGIEGSRWQVSERLGTALIILAVPVYYLLWRSGFFSFGNTEAVLPGVLARLILTLTGIKLLQKKSDRDWVFLYVMGFFQVLLAAGLSISALYVASFVMFTFLVACSIILFEMRKTDRGVRESVSAVRPEGDAKEIAVPGIARLQVTAFGLLTAILVLALPLFFLIPRVGGAGIGVDPGGVSTRSGFSDRVTLGGIGRIQQNDEVVMRVRLENGETAPGLKWRGIALDTFDGAGWSKSRPNSREPRARGERDIIQVDYASGRESLLLQTIYLEPMDTSVLFAAPRAVGIQGNFSVLMRDLDGGLYFQRPGERISYRVISDTSLPDVATLRRDREAYPLQVGNYLQLPDRLDPRIHEMATLITAGDRNRYDAAAHLEQYLQTQFGYTLEQKAGGSDPLSDFLFNVREGHCEYFATAMAVMLRTQGIASRVVTGFQRGDYNETADVYVVRQRQAHAWVEVYFPESDTWVSFDPTPAAGQDLTGATAGLTDRISKYVEALEMIWIQYFVAFDSQEQRSLLTSVRKGVNDYQTRAGGFADSMKTLLTEWWKDVRGENGADTRLAAIGYGMGVVAISVAVLALLVYSIRRLRRAGVWRRLKLRFSRSRRPGVVEFYARTLTLLAKHGFNREPGQTPLEFAYATSIPEVVSITKKYNAVRYGHDSLSDSDRSEIEYWLATFGRKR